MSEQYKIPVRRRAGKEEPTLDTTQPRHMVLTTIKIISNSSGPVSGEVKGLVWANNRSYGRMVFGSYVIQHPSDLPADVWLAGRLSTNVFEILSISSGYDHTDPDLQNLYGDLRILESVEPEPELSPWGRFKGAFTRTAE